MSVPRALLATVLLTTLSFHSASAQSHFSTPRHTLTEAENNAYLSAARKGWVEVDDLSDARPIAACFADHLKTTTPLTLVDRKDATEVVLRFFTFRDFPDAPPSIGKDVFLSVLLLNDEMIWQGTVVPNPSYRGPDASCQYADVLASQLRAAMRAARDGTKPTAPEQQQPELPIREELIWNTKDIGDRITETNSVFVRHAWQFTVHNASDRPQVFDGEVQYLDSGGVVVDRSYVREMVVPAMDERTSNGDTLIRTARAGSVKTVQVSLKRRK
jgi:hypothetical protein